MPLILSSDEEAPGLRKAWLDEYDHVVPHDALEFFGRAEFARLVTDNVRALAAFQSELEGIQVTVNDAFLLHDGESDPVGHARLTLLRLYVQNLRQWRCIATRAQRQWRCASEHRPGTKELYFELPKNGWQERNNIERALNELDSCTDQLPTGWGGRPFGQEEGEVVFDEGGGRMEEGVAEGAGSTGAAAPGLVDYSGSDTESEDDFVLTARGQPAGVRMSDVFPGGEAEEESDETESESDEDNMPSLLSDTDSDDTASIADLMASGPDELPTVVADPVHEFYDVMDALVAQTADRLGEWEAANRETTGEFIDGRFVDHGQ